MNVREALPADDVTTRDLSLPRDSDTHTYSGRLLVSSYSGDSY